ncbi:MAG: hypothetical protein A2Y03_08580 [Omnitrophica WOR_2 bacterium GWF2_38_59]|nr:MAG: hypothetical protein A2Y06_05865 [Omnitrophica WOR_2 bacterium GWA2_37_7]OGX22808.1 MAG: hypothetical protein A2Y03_08580 [Omnitrophica WOR_2 bacterium GWF2_38_59]OGX50765.1 MAG: hypothetical protein A2267_11130 [Omnitrophica WOR_2 bacterium RIFOXYA12_FULL_38_10]OGX50970.1 MAG: hypothetical protein A2243_04015 [Omnitrophica WOR_2 bacterium RIFOXYA2_FULL_38_17]OGX57383.1 MAG: hypothetical protein A2447_03675 [Omnitrophica WOR_2 bacterium RIFOXYC2_FULL_38_12]OGX60488.1 MAG: hypothetical 
MRKELFIMVAAVAFIMFVQGKMNRMRVENAPGVIITANPEQRLLLTREGFRHGDVSISLLAEFSLDAMVLSKQRYYFGRDAELAPYDLALGWGPMSNPEVIKDIRISQGNRWYTYRYKIPPPIPHREISYHSSNMHLVAATKEVAEEIKNVRWGDIIHMEGYLINITGDDGWYWNSSLSRSDTGDGACELIWVEKFSIE